MGTLPVHTTSMGLRVCRVGVETQNRGIDPIYPLYYNGRVPVDRTTLMEI